MVRKIKGFGGQEPPFLQGPDSLANGPAKMHAKKGEFQGPISKSYNVLSFEIGMNGQERVGL
jgi:hypothetical protein